MMDAISKTNRPDVRLLIRSAVPVLVMLFSVRLSAQFVIPAPQPGCLLPTGTVLTELFDGTRASVGVVYHPPVSSIVNAYLGPDTKEWVRTALAGGCPAEAGSDSIALHLKRVTLAESASEDRVSSGAFVDIEVLAWSNDQWRLRYTLEGEAIGKADPNDEGRHARNLIDALHNGMTKYATARAAGQLTYKPFVIGVAAGHVAFPIEKKHGLPPGVFWTADDFRQGRLTPLADSSLVIDQYEDFRLKGDLRRDQEKIFAISDGSHYHVRWQKQFRKLVWDGSHFTSTASRVEVSTGATIAFGLMGAALSSHRVNISLQMDLDDGQLHAVSQTNSEIVKHTLFFEKSIGVEGRLAVQVWEDAVVLEPGTYCELSFPVYGGVELVRLKGPSGTLELAVDANESEEGLHVLYLDAEGRPLQRMLNREEKEAIRERLLPGMLRQVTGQ